MEKVEWALGEMRLRGVPVRPHPAPCTLHTAHYTPNPTPCTLHSKPYTLHSTPDTLHPAPYTLHPKV